MLKLKAAESGCAHFEFTLPLKEDEIAIFQLITALHIPYFLLVLHLLGFRSALAMARRDAAANSEIWTRCPHIHPILINHHFVLK